MIPQRTITATIEIATGSMIFTSRPPVFTGEANAIGISIALQNSGAAYSPTGNVVASMYLYWPGTPNMSEAVELTVAGSTLTGSMPAEMTAVSGGPLLVVQIMDADTEDLIVAAATPIQITNVLGSVVLSSRPATPSEVVYIGRAPYINPTTGTWMQWDVSTSAYVDTEVDAYGRPATFSATATTLPAGSAATASITGTPSAPVLNLGIPRGQDSAVLSVNGETGDVQLNDENIPSTAVSGQTNVEGALSSLSGQKVNSIRYSSQKIQQTKDGSTYTDVMTVDSVPINGSTNPVTSDGVYDAIASLQIADYDSSDESIVFRSSSAATYDSTDESIIINIGGV